MRTLALLRHGRADGQAPDARLTREGEAHLRRLAARLAAEGWRPGAIFSSPYARAQATATLLRDVVAPQVEVRTLRELVPERDPAVAMQVMHGRSPENAIGLFVSHLPLLGLVADALLEQDPGFQPGTLVEIALDEQPPRLLRRIGPADLPADDRP